MRGTRTFGWLVKLPLAVLTMGLVSVLAAPSAYAAPDGTIYPIVNCYWDNGNAAQTVTVSLGYRSTNAGNVTEAVGSRNRFTLGAANRGQPTTFLPGTNNNAFVADVTYTEITNSIDWVVATRGVDISTTTQCPSKPVPADGNTLAVIAFGVLVTAIGSYALSGHRRRRPSAASAA